MSESRDLVTKFSNELNRAKYALTTIEMRILATCFAKIPVNEAVNPNTLYYVSVKELIDLGASETVTYRDIKVAGKNLLKRILELDIRDAQNRPDKIQLFPWVSFVEIELNSGRIGIQFHQRFLPFVSELRRDFTSIPIREIAGLKGYALRFYQLLSQFEDRGRLFIGVADLKRRLSLETKYPRFNSLRGRVIEPAIAQINASEKTAFKVTLEIQKIGVRVDSLTFVMTPKNKSSARALTDSFTLTPKQAGLFAARMVSPFYESERLSSRVPTPLILGEIRRLCSDAPSSSTPIEKMEAWVRNKLQHDERFVKLFAKKFLIPLGFAMRKK